MRSPARSRRRAGFTLLEVLLAALLTGLVLAAVYLAYEMSIQQQIVSREAVDADTLSRGVCHRLTLDLSGTIGPLPPRSGGTDGTATTNGTQTTTTTDPSTTDPTATAAPTDPSASATPTTDPTTTDPSMAVAAPSDDSGSDSASPVKANTAFQSGIIGTNTQLTIFTSRVPTDLAESGLLISGRAEDDTRPAHDLVRITYWLPESGGGLCRQERPWITAQGLGTDPDMTTETTDILASEVTDAQFEYYGTRSDGTTDWGTDWNPDGSALAADGVTPLGPPRAIRVTLWIKLPGTPDGADPKKIVQVIPVRAAPGQYTPPLIQTYTDTSGDGTAAPADSNSSSGTPSSGSGGATAAPGTTSSGSGTKSSGGGTTTPAASPSTSSGSGTKSSGSSAAPATSMSAPSMAAPSSSGTKSTGTGAAPSSGSGTRSTGGGGR